MPSAFDASKFKTDYENLVPYRRWLLAVDRLITQSSLEILKLGFLGDKCGVPFRRLESARTMNALFDLLVQCYGTYEKATQRLLYALKRLGHRRNGYACVRLFQEKVGKPRPPKYDAHSEGEDFGQCFMDICVVIQSDAAEVLIKYCVRLVLKCAPENIPNLPYMLIKMYHSHTVTASDQSALAVVLEIAAANNCIDCIHKYRNKYELPELTMTEALKKELMSKSIPFIISACL